MMNVIYKYMYILTVHTVSSGSINQMIGGTYDICPQVYRTTGCFQEKFSFAILVCLWNFDRLWDYCGFVLILNILDSKGDILLRL